MVGIYFIQNKTTGIVYVGQSSEIEERWQRHKRELASNKHHNIFLQRAWNKYGENDFTFNIAEQCENNRKLLNQRETYWKKHFDNKKGTYNLGATGNVGTMNEEMKQQISKTLKEKHYQNWLGRHHTEATKKLLSEQRKGKKGRPLNEKQKQALLKASKGKVLSEETKKKISLANKGRKMKEETKIKIANSTKGEKNHFYGKHHSEETKEKIRQKHLGTTMSEETRKKMSASRKGRVGGMLGKHHKPETIEKMIHKKPINQYDLNGNFIKQWGSIKEASEELGINNITIWKVLKHYGYAHQTHGFVFKYADKG